MRQFVESLHRLFVAGLLSEKKVLSLLSDGRISEKEKDYILTSI